MKCLIIDDVHHALFPYLERCGIQIDYRPDIVVEEVNEIISIYEILILRSKIQVSKDFLDKATSLKVIGRSGAGLDNVDCLYAQEKGVILIGANEGNMGAVGEHTVGLILSLLHKIVKSNSEIKDFVWNREGNRGEELSCKTVGIIGYGHMGKAVAMRLKGFGCRVIAYDKYLENYSNEFVEQVSMDKIFQETDILTLHVPLNEETKFLVDHDFIQLFHKKIRIINTSRGKVVRLEDLISNIRTSKVLGAALDVLENEKLNSLNDAERQMIKDVNLLENVIVTPHVAGWSVESYRKLSDVLGSKIEALFTKK